MPNIPRVHDRVGRVSLTQLYFMISCTLDDIIAHMIT